ncbi:MAG TPA: hypothetical protein VH437_03060 [Terriglobales bacterium]|jgi:hypothetical protein
MAKTLMQNVVKQLQHEQARLQNQLQGISAALAAFGRTYVRGSKPPRKRHTISAAGRARIAAAQRARWAKVKAKQKKSTTRARRKRS